MHSRAHGRLGEAPGRRCYVTVDPEWVAGLARPQYPLANTPSRAQGHTQVVLAATSVEKRRHLCARFPVPLRVSLPRRCQGPT